MTARGSPPIVTNLAILPACSHSHSRRGNVAGMSRSTPRRGSDGMSAKGLALAVVGACIFRLLAR